MLGLALVLGCLRIGDIPAIYNEPKNLLPPDLSLDQARQCEFENAQARINDAAAGNYRVATTPNRVGLAAIIITSQTVDLSSNSQKCVYDLAYLATGCCWSSAKTSGIP